MTGKQKVSGSRSKAVFQFGHCRMVIGQRQFLSSHCLFFKLGSEGIGLEGQPFTVSLHVREHQNPITL